MLISSAGIICWAPILNTKLRTNSERQWWYHPLADDNSMIQLALANWSYYLSTEKKTPHTKIGILELFIDSEAELL